MRAVLICIPCFALIIHCGDDDAPADGGMRDATIADVSADAAPNDDAQESDAGDIVPDAARDTSGDVGRPVAECASPCSRVIALTQRSATIEITFSQNAPARLLYGPDGTLSFTSLEERSFDYGAPGNAHEQDLEGLTPDTEYFYQVQTQTAAMDWVSIGDVESFRTQEAPDGTFPPSSTSAPSSTEMDIAVPSRGMTIAGDIPGSTIRAVSNDGERHQYSRRSAWNSDETILYVGDRAYRTSDLSEVRNIASMMSSEWVPSFLEPDVVYGTQGSRFLRGTVSTGETEVVIDIGEPIQLGQFEGGISADDRYAVVDSGRILRVIDIERGEVVGGPYDIGGSINGADISHDGAYVSWVSDSRLYYSSRDFSDAVGTEFSSPHSDFCVDVAGDQVMVLFTGSRDATILRMRDGLRHEKTLFATGGGHVSCTNVRRPGYAYFSTYRGDQRAFTMRIDYEDTTTYEDWGFTRQYQVSYEGDTNYDAQSKLSASPSGTQMMYTSEWNLTTRYRDFVLTFSP